MERLIRVWVMFVYEVYILFINLDLPMRQIWHQNVLDFWYRENNILNPRI